MAVAPFATQFDEAIRYLKGKLPEASVAWNDLAGPVHGKVFTVAGATTADLASDIQQALVQALEQGTTLSAFRKDFDRIVAQRGWTYNGSRGWRTAVIFNTNMRSAHMAGRWEQLQANKADRPFLQYRTAGDSRVRPQHRAWNGLVYNIDDAFWQTHYPPNGWGCRCTVRSYSQGDLSARGLRFSDPVKVRTRDVVTADGEITDQVPVGIDPGWDHNVGQAWISPELALGAKLAGLPPDLRGLVTDKTVSPAFQQVISDNWKAFQTAGEGSTKLSNQAQILGFLDSATIASLSSQLADTPLTSTAIAAIDATAARQAVTGPVPWLQDLVDQVPKLLRDYQAVLWDSTRSTLVYVPSGTMPGAKARLATIELRPNQHTNLGDALTLDTLGSQPKSVLTDRRRFTVLVGRMD